jgi:nucleoside-diphosphate-sugar epimerase
MAHEELLGSVGAMPTEPAAKGSVIVLGSNGRLGQASVAAFHREGWKVAAFARAIPKAPCLDHVEYITGDVLDCILLKQAVAGYDVIVNAVNMPYGDWAEMIPKLTNAISFAAANLKATLIIPGNIYHFGSDMPSKLNETVPANPTTTLGQVRLAMERSYQVQSTMNGFQTLVLRAGDFLDGGKTGGWFDGQIAASLAKGNVVYPGPLNVAHEWAYLPDFARAIVALAGQRHRLSAFHALGFAGHNLTGQQLIDNLSRVAGRKLAVGHVPWWIIKLFGLFSPTMKGVSDMAYLWRIPHAIEGRAFDTLVPEFKRTPLPQVFTSLCQQLAAS